MNMTKKTLAALALLGVVAAPATTNATGVEGPLAGTFLAGLSTPALLGVFLAFAVTVGAIANANDDGASG
jgi:hypothetical protein